MSRFSAFLTLKCSGVSIVSSCRWSCLEDNRNAFADLVARAVPDQLPQAFIGLSCPEFRFKSAVVQMPFHYQYEAHDMIIFNLHELLPEEEETCDISFVWSII